MNGENSEPVSLMSEFGGKIIVQNVSQDLNKLALSGNIELGYNWCTISLDDLEINQNSTVTIPDTVRLNVTNELKNNGTLEFAGTSSGVEYVVSNFTNNGKVTQTGTLTINGNFASGNSSSTYASVTLAPTGDEVTVSGFGKITKLTLFHFS